jgi:ADP-ribose pyrophosphatase
MPSDRIDRRREVPVFDNDYGTLFDDEVRGPSGQEARYLRWRWRRPGVIVIPCRGELVGLCRMYRYSIGTESLELPRGAIEPGEALEAAALRELREETGLVGSLATVVGRIYPETGLIEQAMPVVAVDGSDEGYGAVIEPLESILPGIVWDTLVGWDEALRSGRVVCGTSIAALALLRAHRGM